MEGSRATPKGVVSDTFIPARAAVDRQHATMIGSLASVMPRAAVIADLNLRQRTSGREPQAENDEPHPQVLFTFGFWNLKPEP